MTKKTNPDTCQHRVIQNIQIESSYFDITICVSCDATLDLDYVNERKGSYQYDIDKHVWVYYGPNSKYYKENLL